MLPSARPGLISFNSRLREEATVVHPKLHYSKNVSTHASVRRRLILHHPGFIRIPVSTHASVRRRPACAKPLARADEFQLTPP